MIESKVGNIRKELGYHGYVAIFLFVRNTFMQSNFIRYEEMKCSEVSLGINLVVTRASNKVLA